MTTTTNSHNAHESTEIISGTTALPAQRDTGAQDERDRDAGTSATQVPDTPEVPAGDTAESGAEPELRESGHDAAPGAAAPSSGQGPIIPEWLRSRAQVRDVAGHHAHRVAFIGAFHAVRCPVYATRLVWRAPVGAWRAARHVALWVWDAEERNHVIAAKSENFRAERTAREDRRARLKARMITAVLVGLFVVCAWWATFATSTLLGVVVTAVGVMVLGWVGRGVDPITDTHKGSRFEVPSIDRALIETALASLGIAELNRGLKKDQGGHAGLVWTAPIVRDGAGYRAVMVLPAGVTANDIIERRAALASGLRRPLSCVWPSGDETQNEAHLVLYVADKPLSSSALVKWPFAKTGTTDTFGPVMIGRSPQGKDVPVTLMFASGVIGAVPRVGKTFLLRLIGLVGALDVRCDLAAFDFKGTGDLGCFEHVATAYRCGTEPEDVEYVMSYLRQVREDMKRRSRVLRELPKDTCPENKLTPDIAANTSLNVGPVMILIDECQELFEHATHGKEAAEICTDLVKRGPALGIMLWLATQRVDRHAVPTSISSNAVLRACLKVTGQVENDMILGTSMYKAGYRATIFSRKDLGVAYLAGEGDDPTILRSAFVDAPMAEHICERARALRKKLGRLTGYATGDDHTTTAESVLDHLATIWPGTQAKVWCSELAERLAKKFDAYADWDATNIAPALRPFGITTTNVKKDGSVRKGIARTDVLTALEQTTPPSTESNNQEGENSSETR